MCNFGKNVTPSRFRDYMKSINFQGLHLFPVTYILTREVYIMAIMATARIEATNGKPATRNNEKFIKHYRTPDIKHIIMTLLYRSMELFVSILKFTNNNLRVASCP